MKFNAANPVDNTSSLVGSDTIFYAPKKSYNPTPAHAASSKVPTVNSFSILGKAQNIENKSTPPVKRDQKANSKSY